MADYRPAPGERLFVSTFDNRPRVITVLEYFWHNNLPGEQLRYVRGDGTKGHSTVDYIKFYPDVPLDIKYLYLVQAEESNYDARSYFHELGYFFKPEDAFQHIKSILAGEVRLSRDMPNIRELDFSVLVEEV